MTTTFTARGLGCQNGAIVLWKTTAVDREQSQTAILEGQRSVYSHAVLRSILFRNDLNAAFLTAVLTLQLQRGCQDVLYKLRRHPPTPTPTPTFSS